jgi:hypothetical protein
MLNELGRYPGSRACSLGYFRSVLRLLYCCEQRPCGAVRFVEGDLLHVLPVTTEARSASLPHYRLLGGKLGAVGENVAG